MPATTDIWSWILLRAGLWLGLVAIAAVICWYLMDFVFIRAGYANCRLKAFLRNDIAKDTTTDLIQKKILQEVNKKLGTSRGMHEIDYREADGDNRIKVVSVSNLFAIDASNSNVNNSPVPLMNNIADQQPMAGIPGAGIQQDKDNSQLDRTNLIQRSNVDASKLAAGAAYAQVISDRISTQPMNNNKIVTNISASPYLPQQQQQQQQASNNLPAITQLPSGGTEIPNEGSTQNGQYMSDMSDRMEIARIASEMSGMSIRMNPWIKMAMSGGNLNCRRAVKAPSEMPLNNMTFTHANEVCTWICSKRFSGNLGRFAGTFDTTDNTCMCYIQDCASTAKGPSAGRTRQVVETPTNGVLIKSKDSAAAMCPSICLMQYPGRNAEALASWDGKPREGQTLTAQDQTCFCVVDTEGQ